VKKKQKSKLTLVQGKSLAPTTTGKKGLTALEKLSDPKYKHFKKGTDFKGLIM